jgi:hypothetical protein
LTAVPFFKITSAVVQEHDSIDHQCKKGESSQAKLNNVDFDEA